MKTLGFCDLYKIGLESGKKYNPKDIWKFHVEVLGFVGLYNEIYGNGLKDVKFYFKDGLLKAAGITRSELPDNCVIKGYNIFNNK
jgi:hypothetical protein